MCKLKLFEITKSMTDAPEEEKYMCTRYYYDNSNAELADYYEAASHSPIGYKFAEELSKPVIGYGEVRPTDVVPVLAPNKAGEPAVFAMKWGFTMELPKSSNTGNKGSLIVNARVETANQKVSFKDLWIQRRCIIPCSYYFEWKHVKDDSTGKIITKEKYLIQPAGQEITYLAGLYRIENGYPVFVVLTTAPSPTLSEIHDRMPVLLPKEQITEWIRPKTNPSEILPYMIKETSIEHT